MQNVGESVYCEVERFSSSVPVRRVGIRSVVVVIHPNASVDSAVVKCSVKSKISGSIVGRERL